MYVRSSEHWPEHEKYDNQIGNLRLLRDFNIKISIILVLTHIYHDDDVWILKDGFQTKNENNWFIYIFITYYVQ